jgi:hypothetical protein
MLCEACCSSNNKDYISQLRSDSPVVLCHLFHYKNTCHFTSLQVQAILRPTVSRPVRLGVVSLLERVTRFYISLSGNYFLYFSCSARSLTRGRVCNLQCNDSGSSPSFIATDGQSVSSSWCRAPMGSMTRF